MRFTECSHRHGKELCQLLHPTVHRHSGAGNCAFLDWSIRRIDLKQLWTLKWNRTFSTTGPWTRRGGCQPENWPEWMRGLKDY